MADAPSLPRDDTRKSSRLDRVRRQFERFDDADKKQRTRELEDLKFYAGDQWPDDIRSARRGMTLGSGDTSIPVPARPCITINKTREPVRTVLNQERGSDMGIEIVPADDFGDLAEPISETEIQLREGLTRRIQRESKAADARTWAFSRATIAGRGVYGVMIRFAKGKTRDQEIYVHRYFNQAAVLMDPAHEQPDGSDCEEVFVGADLSWAEYKAQHSKRNGKDNRLLTCTDSEWRAYGDEQPDWFDGEGDQRTLRVVDHYYTKYTTRTVVTYRSPDGAEERTEWLDELPEPPEGWTEFDRHEDIQKTIKVEKIDGCDDDVLEETDWPGPDMPFVKVLGEELHPYDKERRVEGMVRPMREPCQGNNAMVSKFVEMVAMTPIPTLMLANGQQEGFEAWYQAAMTRTLPYLLFNQKDAEDMPAPPPFSPPNRDMPIAPVAAGLQMFSEAIQSTSAISDPAMGQTDATVKSAKHANLLREQAAQGTSNFLDNLMRSMRYEAQIINNLLYPIYGSRPGRLARIIDGQGEASSVLLHQPMTMQDKRPMPAQAGAPNAKTYTLTKDAQFNVAVKISKNHETRRQQEAAELGELIGNAPALLNVFGDLYFKNLDGPGHNEMAERMKVMLDPKVLAMLEAKAQGQDIPPQAQAQIQQLTQQVQQATMAAQQLQQQLQADAVKEQAETQRVQAKLAADMELAKVKAQTELQRAQMDNAARIEVARIAAAKELANAQLEAQEERLATGLQIQHEQTLAGQQQAHDAEQADRQQQAQSVEAERSRQAASESQAVQQGHEASMAQQAAEQAAQQAQQGV